GGARRGPGEGGGRRRGGVLGGRRRQRPRPRRYGSAEALAEDLERWLRNEPILARPVGRLERAVKWARRRPAAAALLGVSLVAAVVLGGVVTAFSLALFQSNRDLRHANDRLTEAIGAKDQANIELTFQRNKALDNETKAKEQTQETKKALARARTEEEKAEQRYQVAQRTALTAQLLRASQLLERDPGRARQLLEDTTLCPLNLRDFTWSYYATHCGKDHLALGDPTETVSDASFSANGRLLAVAYTDAQGQSGVRIWDVATRTPRLRLPGAAGSLVFSADGE